MVTVYVCKCCGGPRPTGQTGPCQICGYDTTWGRKQRRFHIRRWARAIEKVRRG